jgi:response regulator RpfG family c-di-GMP phosphodiesterase
VQELTSLLTRLRQEDEPLARAERILEWSMHGLGAAGVALLQAEASPGAGLSVMRPLGSLATLDSETAGTWLRDGLPLQPCIVALPTPWSATSMIGAGGSSEGGRGIGGDASAARAVCALFVMPLNRQDGVAWSAVILDALDLGQFARARDTELRLAALLLRETLENAQLRHQLHRTRSLNPNRARLELDDSLPIAVGFEGLVDGLQLPMYLCDPRGRFLFASGAFLGLTGYPSLEALRLSTTLFADPARRVQELEHVLSTGKVSSYPVSVTSGEGKRLEIQESAVSLGDKVLGIFFDVSDLMSANAEMKDSLQVQEFLNDSIIAGTRTLQRTQGAAIRALARLAEHRDPETGHHLQRICEYARLLAAQVYQHAPYSFRITREYGDDLSLSSMLHDIGKVSIPDSILLKPGKLDADEWGIMKRHTVFGWEVLSKADKELGEQSFLTLAATIALSHHERYDGTGYPHSIKGENIPLSARISSLADVYDALTTARPYKEPWSHDRAMDEIVRQSGSHFDPVLVEIFTGMHEQFAEVHRLFPG